MLRKCGLLEKITNFSTYNFEEKVLLNESRILNEDKTINIDSQSRLLT